MALLSKDCEPDNSKSHKSIKRRFSNTQVLCSNFLEYKFSPESNSPNILGLCETKLLQSIDYLHLIRKDSVSHMHDLAVYLKERLLFAQDLSLESSDDSYLCFRLVSLHSISYLFFLHQSLSSSLCTVFDAVLFDIGEVLSLNPSANMFVLGDFKIHPKDWLIFSGRTNRLIKLCYNFSFSNDLTQMVSFPTRIPNCDSLSILLFWI